MVVTAGRFLKQGMGLMAGHHPGGLCERHADCIAITRADYQRDGHIRPDCHTASSSHSHCDPRPNCRRSTIGGRAVDVALRANRKEWATAFLDRE
jgi:hypothetical protein